ncbi:hypothetical protein HanRHA438_Chr07g0301051 [Helianthus annuus]|nr:hypothetical protein HanRHA438_Chr07g0301051 [Helianthus annuus]
MLRSANIFFTLATSAGYPGHPNSGRHRNSLLDKSGEGGGSSAILRTVGVVVVVALDVGGDVEVSSASSCRINFLLFDDCTIGFLGSVDFCGNVGFVTTAFVSIVVTTASSMLECVLGFADLILVGGTDIPVVLPSPNVWVFPQFSDLDLVLVFELHYVKKGYDHTKKV